jgi:putative membrane protein
MKPHHLIALALSVAPVVAFAQSATESAAGAKAQPSLTDANIAAIVVAANDVDIAAGKLAQQKAESAAVRALADMMITDHEAVNKAAVALVTKLKVTPVDTAFSNRLKATGKKTNLELDTKQGAEFDRAYTANEVAYHQAVIAAVDTVLLPAVNNPELKVLIEQVRPALQGHLDHARHVLAELK